MKRDNILLIFIIILGFVLRLINIDKPEGLWNDEYVSWFVAATPFRDGFWTEVLMQCHMPLYYLYLKPFCACSDLILRLTSVLPSVLAIPVMYFTGCEVSKRNGLIAAALTSVLSFLIYYSQEVRFYSLLFLFSALLLLFTLKLLKESNRFNITGYLLSGTLLVLTHVLGFIYLFFNTVYLVYKKKHFSAKIILPALILGIIILFFGLNILKMAPSSQWWGNFSYTNILFLFSDFLSPILTNNINAPSVFFYNKTLLFTIFITLPTIIGLTGLLLGYKKHKGITLTVLLTLFAMSLLGATGKIVFITKYSIEILPAIILLIASGFENRILLISAFILFHIGAVFTPFYTAKIMRLEGNKLLGDILNNVKTDTILYTYYEPDRFTRYYKETKPSIYISKLNRFEYVENPSQILNGIKKGERVTVVFLDSVSFIPPSGIEIAKENKVPEMFITFSQIRNSLIQTLNDNYRDFDIQKSGYWTVITGTKVK